MHSHISDAERTVGEFIDSEQTKESKDVAAPITRIREGVEIELGSD